MSGGGRNRPELTAPLEPPSMQTQPPHDDAGGPHDEDAAQHELAMRVHVVAIDPAYLWL